MHYYRFISEEMGIIFAYPRITGQGEVYLYHSLDTSTHSILLEKMQQTLSFQITTIEEYPVEEYYNNYLFSVPELAQNMTNRQLEILAEAYYGGYYKIPRMIRTRDIAETNQSSRYNIDKILRNVEGKIMQFIYPFLR
jgi:predicted DNA binding protein